MARAPKLISRRLIALDREIAAMLNLRSHRQTVRKKGNSIARFFETYWKQFRYGGTRAMAASSSNLNPIAASSIPQAHEPKTATDVKRTSKKEVVRRASALGLFLSICFGLLAICGVIVALLLLQIKNMKVEMAGIKQRLAAAEAYLGKSEKIAQQQIVKETTIVDNPPRHSPITLGNDDTKAIRAFIKVLPSKSGAQPKIHLGDMISDIGSAPVPESLINQVPKLRGAKFLVDQNGAIIIVGEGSNRADAVIESQ
jgi:hypothetical protein